MKPFSPDSVDSPIWIPARRVPLRTFYPCHGDNVSFAGVLEVFRAKSTRFKATTGRPRAGCHFFLQLPTSRFAELTRYDDYPLWLDIGLELEERPSGEAVVYHDDLRCILTPLDLPMPDKSNVGFPLWR